VIDPSAFDCAIDPPACNAMLLPAAANVSDIARELKVVHLLEGSVRKSGNRLRVTAQLNAPA
jgi:TolB-like protein